MALSLNAMLTVPRELRQGEPPGEPLAEQLSRGLRPDWTTHDPENWRDSGWSLECRRAEAILECVVAALEDDRFLLQVAPLRSPGWLGRLVGSVASASIDETVHLAEAVHQVLSELDGVSGLRWQWDGLPDERSFPSPRRP